MGESNWSRNGVFFVVLLTRDSSIDATQNFTVSAFQRCGAISFCASVSTSEHPETRPGCKISIKVA